MVHFPNVTIEVSLPEAEADYQPSVTRFVHWQDTTSEVAYEQFSVEVKKGYLIFDEPEAIDLYVEFGKVEVDGKTYAIKAPPHYWNFVPAAAHIEVLVEQIRTAETTTEPTLAPR